MTENDTLAVLIVATAVVKLTQLTYSYRKARRAAERAAAKTGSTS